VKDEKMMMKRVLLGQSSSVVGLNDSLEMTEQPQPCALVGDGEEGTGNVASEDESWREEKVSSSTGAGEWEKVDGLIPLASREMVARSEMGTSHPTLSLLILTRRIRVVVRMTTSVSSDDGRSRWAT
jgi:hypothetical protein